MTRLTKVRTAWGAFLLLGPETLAAPSRAQIDPATLIFERVLGARHLIQAVVVCRWPNRLAILIGAATDAAHALTMLALAAVNTSRRTPKLVNCATAFAFALAGLRQSKRTGATAGSFSQSSRITGRIRTRVARLERALTRSGEPCEEEANPATGTSG
jgi:hypothetical protein